MKKIQIIFLMIMLCITSKISCILIDCTTYKHNYEKTILTTDADDIQLNIDITIDYFPEIPGTPEHSEYPEHIDLFYKMTQTDRFHESAVLFTRSSCVLQQENEYICTYEVVNKTEGWDEKQKKLASEDIPYQLCPKKERSFNLIFEPTTGIFSLKWDNNSVLNLQSSFNTP